MAVPAAAMAEEEEAAAAKAGTAAQARGAMNTPADAYVPNADTYVLNADAYVPKADPYVLTRHRMMRRAAAADAGPEICRICPICKICLLHVHNSVNVYKKFQRTLARGALGGIPLGSSRVVPAQSREAR